MNWKAILCGILITLFLFSVEEADAQRRGSSYKKRRSKSRKYSNFTTGRLGGRFRPYHFVQGNVNALNYYGDLAPVNRAASTDVNFTRPGFGGSIGYKFSPYSAVRAGFNYGRIKGDDITSDPTVEASYPRYLRNASFRSDIKELQMGFEFFLFPNYGGHNVRPKMNMYLFVGAALFHHEPKGLVPQLDYTTGGTEPAPQAGEWVKLRKLGTEGQFLEGSTVKPYLPIQFSVPIAVGVTMRLEGPFDVGLELGYRYLFTDYIDDVSTNYVAHDQFTNPLARIMADRSAEPVAAWAQLDRGVGTASQRMADGNVYYSAESYGGGLAPGTRRGNPGDKDMIFMTTIRVTYIIQKRGAKFR